jgi:hypothetical protein
MDILNRMVRCVLASVACMSCLSLLAATVSASTINQVAKGTEGAVVVLRPAGEHFASVVSGIADDVDGDLSVIDIEYETLDMAELIKAVQQYKVNAIVLMGNNTINEYKKNIAKMPKGVAVVNVAALFVDRVSEGIPNSTGILYEIPAVTSLVGLRAVLASPVKRVGVLYREQFASTIEQNVKFAAMENVTLVPVSVASAATEKDVEAGLKLLAGKEIDAIWVTNDSGLLQPKMVGASWIPFIKSFKKPVVVGVETLAKTEFDFGSFVVFPDHYGLGAQAAGVLLDLLDNDWDASDAAIAQPISVKKHLNATITEKRGIAIKPKALGTIDAVIR